MFVDAGRFHRIRCTFLLIGIEWGILLMLQCSRQQSTGQCMSY